MLKPGFSELPQRSFEDNLAWRRGVLGKEVLRLEDVNASTIYMYIYIYLFCVCVF